MYRAPWLTCNMGPDQQKGTIERGSISTEAGLHRLNHGPGRLLLPACPAAAPASRRLRHACLPEPPPSRVMREAPVLRLHVLVPNQRAHLHVHLHHLCGSSMSGSFGRVVPAPCKTSERSRSAQTDSGSCCPVTAPGLRKQPHARAGVGSDAGPECKPQYNSAQRLGAHL